ncbi:MAG: oxidoreductase [Burkholderiaceae bacterium]|nr:oxidoreductase [Burkholderiaceae bacterium]
MLTLLVRSITYEAENIRSFELVDPSGKDLPPFEAGAHIDVSVPGGLTRQYSLCDSPGSRKHYRIAVLEDHAGRGGSKAMHASLRAGDMLDVSEPRNLFPLKPGARHNVLLAGGIGITPLLSMVDQLQRDQQSFELHYCTQKPERTAFRSRLQSLVAGDQAFLHHDGGDPKNGLDIVTKLEKYEEGVHLYFCGPPGFMKAVQKAAAHWPEHAVHYEYFGVDPSLAEKLAASAPSEGVQIRLAKSDKVLTVEPGQTILAAIRQAGVACESSCESGLCGTCKVRYFSGKPDHNDFVLSEEEKNEYVLVCCAGPGTEALLLDL